MPLAARHRSIVIRAGLYVAGVLVLSNLLLTEWADTLILGPVRELVARMTGWLFAFGGASAEVSGEIVRFPSGAVQIVDGCTGVDVMIFLACAVLIFPASPRAKLIGVLLSVVVVGFVNFVRVLTLCYFVSSSPAYLELGHVYVWPAIITLVCLGTLVFWIQKVAEARP